METVKPVRLVPSGKVYRQMFDAEVQLVQKLEKRERGATAPVRRSPRSDADEIISMQSEAGQSVRATKSAVPVVRMSKSVAGTGMLNNRQQTWIQGFPNENFVENPVLYKHFSEALREETEEPESSVASKEVRGLPDVLAPAKVGSDIIKRIEDSRLQRHAATLEDMHQELGIISNELEPQIIESSDQLIVRLAENDTFIQQVMARIENDEELMIYSLEDLTSLWEEAAAHSKDRQDWIESLDKRLSDLEEARMQRIREIFAGYAKTLEKIAHMMPPDLARLLDKESQLINQAVLSNRRAYADLYCRLMMSDIEREKRLHVQWTDRLEDWKKLHTDLAMQNFRQFMDSKSITDPPGAKDVLDKMKEEQNALNYRRIELVNSLRELKPPASTKTSVYKWNQQISDISKEIDHMNQDFFNRLYAEYEKVCQLCLEKVDEIKADLIDRGICSEAKAQIVINEQCLPLVGSQQSQFEQTLEEMDKSLEEHNAHVLAQLKSLFKYCQGAAHVWDVHEIGLAKQERALQEKLDECRHLHDNENQDKEANLDILMDRMRQDAAEDALKESLKKGLLMLENIKAGYTDFHQRQQGIVGTYPDMVNSELKNYDKAVCRFFTVDRRNPENGDISDDQQSSLDSSSEAGPLRDEKEETQAIGSPKSPKTPRKKKKMTKQRPSSRQSAGSRNSDSENKPSTPIPLAVSEVLSTAKGTTFYVLTVAGEHGVQVDESSEDKKTDSTAFLTEAPDGTKETKDYIQSVDVPDSLIMEIKKIIRMHYLDHLEDWCEQAIDRSRSVVAAKTEELNSELDLRMHLHQPRSRRAELDVHNVRAAELVMHGERVTRHCKGITQALSDLKSKFNEMTQEHNDLADKFREDIEALETVFINATKSAKLVALSNQLQIEQDKYMNVIRTSLRQFRQQLDDTLQMLRESNARFIKSFKLFSDGGNFCPEEIDEYRKRLEKMAQRIDSAEGFIMADLEGMESKRLEQASKIASEFEDRFKHHMIDLLFMEKIARWLTNTQVKIKAEVADSNTQAQKLTQYLRDLERRIDACVRPNLDKEQITPSQLNESLKMLFEAFHDRSIYLSCMKESMFSARPSSAQTMAGNPALGARVGFTSDAMPPVSRPGKQPSEDPSVGIIKNIIKTQKNRFGMDADLDGDFSHQQNAVLPAPAAVFAVPADASHSKSSKSRPPTDDLRSKKSSRQGTAANSQVANETPKRTQSGAGSLATLGNRFGSTETVSSMRGSITNSTMAQKSLKKLTMMSLDVRRINHSKGLKYDRKYMVFGEKEEPGEDTHLLGKIRHILREALDGLLTAAELYYRQKGTRLVTRPQALQETFEMCADIVVAKLQSYYHQADEYHNQCLQELRGQLDELEKGVGQVPRCVIEELLRESISSVKSELTQLDSEFGSKLTEWDARRLDHQNELRPTLGHPQQAGELSQLCQSEEQRRLEYLTGVGEHMQKQQDLTVEHGAQFIEKLAKISEELLLQFDSLLTVDDIERGRVPPTKYPTSELQRRKNAGRPLDDQEEKEGPPRGKNSWQGIPRTELVVPKELQLKPEKKPESKPVKRVKSVKSERSDKSEKTEKTEKTEKVEDEQASVLSELPSVRRSVTSAASSKASSKVSSKPPPVLHTAQVTTAKTTLGHSAAVEARNWAYDEYKSHFEQTLKNIEEERQKHIIAEQRWTDSWALSIDKVKELY